MKRNLSIVSIATMIASVVLMLATCSSVIVRIADPDIPINPPRYIRNPSSNPQDTVQSLVRDGWEVRTDTDWLGRISMIDATRQSHSDSVLSLARTDTRVWFAFAFVMYFDSTVDAREYYYRSRSGLVRLNYEVSHHNVRFRHSLDRNGAVLSAWMSFSGAWGEVRAAGIHSW